MKLTQSHIQFRFRVLRAFCFWRAVRASCALCVFCSLCALLAPAFQADEGMWLFNNPPVKLLQEKYHFQPTAAWLEHV